MKALIDWAWNASINDLACGCIVAAIAIAWIVSLFRREK